MPIAYSKGNFYWPFKKRDNGDNPEYVLSVIIQKGCKHTFIQWFKKKSFLSSAVRYKRKYDTLELLCRTLFKLGRNCRFYWLALGRIVTVTASWSCTWTEEGLDNYFLVRGQNIAWDSKWSTSPFTRATLCCNSVEHQAAEFNSKKYMKGIGHERHSCRFSAPLCLKGGPFCHKMSLMKLLLLTTAAITIFWSE